MAAGLLALTACSGAFTIYAVDRDGRLAFDVEAQSSGFESCIRSMDIIGPDGMPVWSISRARIADQPCENEFPIIYGEVPGGFTEDIAAVPLEFGPRYTINGRSPGVYYGGAFVATSDGRYVNYNADEPRDVPDDIAR